MKLKTRCILLAILIIGIFSFSACVGQAEEENKAVYRALVIGVDAYKEPLRGCVPDAQRVSAMLQAANEGGAFYQAPVLKLNPTADQITAAFSEMSGWGADEDDVTFVFFSGAAILNDKGTAAGLLGQDGGIIDIKNLKAPLAQVSGTKILVFNCVYPLSRLPKGVSSLQAVEKLDELMYQTFGGDELQYVLCFASDSEMADIVNSVSNQQFGIGVYFLSQACGYDYQNERPCDLLADANADGAVSLSEAARYVGEKTASFFSASGLKDLKLSVLAHPETSQYPILARRASTQAVSVELDRKNAEIPVDKGIRLSAEIMPPNATDKTILWTCSDLAVASVDQQGNVKALRMGEAVITATAANGISESCIIKVRPVRRAESIAMSMENMVVVTGTEMQLKLTTVPDNINEQIVWSSSDEEIAEVTQTGLVKAKEAGSVTVTATTEGGLSAQCDINVAQKGTVVEAVNLKDHAISCFQGDKKTLEVKLVPENPKDKTIYWTSSDEAVATVSSKGEVTAVGQGTCTVTAMASSGVSAECEVTVRGAVVEIKTPQFNMVIGRSERLIHRLIPADAQATIEWKSSDESVATVDETGMVTAVGFGGTVITAQVVGGGKAECAVTVSQVQITQIQFKDSNIKMGLGQVKAMEVRVKPDVASELMLAWDTSNPEVATVDEKGTVTALAEGKVDIMAMAESGVTATCRIEVKAIAVSKIRVKPSTLSLIAGIDGSDTAQLTVETAPENATDPGVTWKSSDEKVAIVSEDGMVKALSEGKAVIRATAKSGKVYAECKVKVSPNGVSYNKPQTGSAQKLYVSAKRIYYDNDKLFVELYFVNKTKETILLPKAGTLVLRWKDGRTVDLMEVVQGDKSLAAGKSNTLTYEISLTEPGNEQFAGFDLREAQATIRTAEEMAVQEQLAVPEVTSDLGIIQRPEDTQAEGGEDESDFVDELGAGEGNE